MVTDSHRAEIATVPQEVLQRIMELPDPSFESVNDELPDQYQYLAQNILDLLTEPPEAYDEAESDESGYPQATSSVTATALTEDRAEHLDDQATNPPVANSVGQQAEGTSAASNRAAAFLDALTEEEEPVRSGFNPEDLLPDFLIDRFVPYQHGAVEDRVARVRAVYVPASGERSPIVELSWDAHSEPGTSVTVYRVVSTTNIGQPASPEHNDQLALTLGTNYEDEVRPTEAYREYQIWAYAGANENDCFRRQPVLLGRKLVIFPVRGLTVNASDGKISGTWESLPGHHRMRVYVTDAKLGLPADNPGSELSTGVSDRDFRYSSPVQGVTMNVAVKPEIQHGDGTVEVGPISEVVSVTLHGNLTQTNFESVERLEHDEGTLIWFSVFGPPGGNFRVYITEDKPDKDLSWQAVDLSSLPQGGLEGNFQDYGEIPHNEQFEADQLWPDGWDAVFVTPVTVLGDNAWVGNTVALQRVQEVTEPELREYVGFQLATFAWPQGASMVKVERQFQGGEERSPVKDFSEEDYARDGGIPLKLDPGGEEVVLTPQNSYAGQTTYGPETVLTYPGLRRFFYDIQVQPAHTGGAGGLHVAVWADGHDDLNPPSFAALLNRNRLPLAADDLHQGGVRLRATAGDQVGSHDLGSNLATNHISADVTQASRWFIPASEFESAGYFRLFLQQFHSVTEGAVRKILTDERLTLRHITDEDIRIMTEIPVPPPEPVAEPAPEPHSRSWFRRR